MPEQVLWLEEFSKQSTLVMVLSYLMRVEDTVLESVLLLLIGILKSHKSVQAKQSSIHRRLDKLRCVDFGKNLPKFHKIFNFS